MLKCLSNAFDEESELKAHLAVTRLFRTLQTTFISDFRFYDDAFLALNLFIRFYNPLAGDDDGDDYYDDDGDDDDDDAYARDSKIQPLLVI